MFNQNISKSIKFWSMIGIIIIIIIMALIIMINYSIEGEKKLPYKLSKITIISTAEGVENVKNSENENVEDSQNEENNRAWELNVIQLNDIYISIDKTEFAEEGELLTGVRIENIKITKTPKIGGIKVYMPNSLEGRIYNYTDDYLVQSSLQYTGASHSNSRNLEVGNQGGLVLISFVNNEIGRFVSEENDVEIKHDGTLISKINQLGNGLENTVISEEDLKFSVSFDLVLQIDNKEYAGNVKLDLPCGELIENGKATIEITDFSDVVFKR